MIAKDALEQVQTIYIAYYGRPGDPVGVDFWTAELNANGGNIVDAFGTSEEFLENYGGLGSIELVETLYQQTLGRAPDDAGLQFFVELLESGSKSLASIALDIANGVQGDDIDSLGNKLTVAQIFTDTVTSTGVSYAQSEIASAKLLLANVDEGQLSVEGDRDFFVVELTAGTEYLFNLEGLSSRFGSLVDPELTIYNDATERLSMDDDSGEGLNSFLAFTPPSTGFYFLDAHSSGDAGTGTYVLNMDFVGNDAVADDSGTQHVLRVGETLHGHLDSDTDEDWFAVTLTAGTEYSFRAATAGEANASFFPAVLDVYDVSGSSLLTSGEGEAGAANTLVFTPTASGTYYMGVSNSEHSLSQGRYTLTVREPFNTTPLTMTFLDPDGELDAFREVIEENLIAAWSLWDLYIDAEFDATLDIVVAPVSEERDESGNILLASASPATFGGLGGDLFRGAPGIELITGADINGDQADGRISINTVALEEVSYDFSPDAFTPFSQTSFEDVLAHEIGHLLGFVGGAGFMTPFEARVDFSPTEFTGERAVALNGAPVALDENSVVHLDRNQFPGALMRPSSSSGGIDEITDLEIAILADIGIPIHEQPLLF